MKQELEKLINKKIVVDTRTSWVYIGTLEEVTDNCVVLVDVDVHDSNDSSTSKDLYIFDTKATGVKSNRKSVYINISYIVSFSMLEDVKQF